LKLEFQKFRFAARYFDLRDFAKKNNAVFELEPLNEADAKELEVISYFILFYFILFYF